MWAVRRVVNSGRGGRQGEGGNPPLARPILGAAPQADWRPPPNFLLAALKNPILRQSLHRPAERAHGYLCNAKPPGAFRGKIALLKKRYIGLLCGGKGIFEPPNYGYTEERSYEGGSKESFVCRLAPSPAIFPPALSM